MLIAVAYIRTNRWAQSASSHFTCTLAVQCGACPAYTLRRTMHHAYHHQCQAAVKIAAEATSSLSRPVCMVQAGRDTQMPCGSCCMHSQRPHLCAMLSPWLHTRSMCSSPSFKQVRFPIPSCTALLACKPFRIATRKVHACCHVQLDVITVHSVIRPGATIDFHISSPKAGCDPGASVSCPSISPYLGACHIRHA